MTSSSVLSENHETPLVLSIDLQDNMKQLEISLHRKLDDILKVMNSQADTLKRQEDVMTQFKADQEQIKADQDHIKKSINGLCREVNETKQKVQQNSNQILSLFSQQDVVTKTVADLETELDRLEGFSRRNNVKLFGIPEAKPGEREDCAEAVKHVLQTYIPEEKWRDDVIERAHRLGTFNPNYPNTRPIIAKFQRWGDLMRLMRDRPARDAMEKDGLRTGQDLTRRQMATLRDLRNQGKAAHYVNGRLLVKDQRASPTSTLNLQSHDRGYSAAGNRGNPCLFTSDVLSTLPDQGRAQPTRDSEVSPDATPERVKRVQTRSATRQASLSEMAWGKTQGDKARVGQKDGEMGVSGEVGEQT